MSNPVSEMIENAMKNIKGMVDVNSIVGTPMKVDTNTLIIPVAKISYGFGGGGSEIISKNKTNDKNFAGGIGGGTSVKAEAFLVISGGNVRIVPVTANASTADKIVDLVPEMVDKVSGFFASNKKDGESEAE